jgi:hypothetical protein
MSSNIFDTFIEVELKNPEDFLKVKETLTRIGILSKGQKRLSQTCHILHKQGKYYIVHFLEMFILDGKGKNFTDDDILRRNLIASLLEEWGLVKIVNYFIVKEKASIKSIYIITAADKPNYELVSKYSIGVKK